MIILNILEVAAEWHPILDLIGTAILIKLQLSMKRPQSDA